MPFSPAQVVFVVDASNTERFEECREELASLLSFEETAHLPFLILGNKIDRKEVPHCPSPEQICLSR